MMLIGGKLNLLRGFMVNEENAQFQQAELAGPQAEIKVAQKRQDLYLAGAVQYWDWQVAVKQADVVKRTLAVAEERYRMVEGRSKGGAIAPIDVVEAREEVQRRREAAIAAQRKVEYEQYKLALFLWEDGPGRPVSLAGCAGRTPNGIRIGPVYTPTELRGRGYASALTAALTQALLDGGRRFCFLFVDVANPTSNRIYERIGYRPVTEVDEWRFS